MREITLRWEPTTIDDPNIDALRAHLRRAAFGVDATKVEIVLDGEVLEAYERDSPWSRHGLGT